MGLKEYAQKIAKKKMAFEYFVFCLEKWKKEQAKTNTTFTKLQLHKLLFLASSIGATSEKHDMLNIFNTFYALKYGPVEMDVYNSMQSNTFSHLKFDGNDCILLDSINGLEIEDRIKSAVDNSVSLLRDKNERYVLMSPYQLVDITHGWTVWQISMAVADLCGSKKERMSTDEIINSTIKTF